MAIEKRVSSRTGKTTWHVRISLGTDANGKRVRESIGTYALLEEAQEAERAGFRWRVQHAVDLHDADLRPVDFNGLDLTEKDLRGANLSGTNVEASAKLSAARFDHAKGLRDEQIETIRAAGAFVDSYRESARNGIDWSHVKQALVGADLHGLSLIGASFGESNLTSSTFDDSNLLAADLEAATLTSASLRNAVLFRANLRGASLDEVDLTGADLSRASLRNALMAGTDILAAASLAGADLTDVTGLDEETLRECERRGAHLGRFIETGPPPNTRRYRDFSKWKGMAMHQVQQERATRIEALKRQPDPMRDKIANALAAALDAEAFISGPYGLNKRYMSEFKEVALNLIAWTADEVGFVAREPDVDEKD